MSHAAHAADVFRKACRAIYLIAPLQRALGLPLIGGAVARVLTSPGAASRTPFVRLYRRRSHFFFSEGSLEDDVLRRSRIASSSLLSMYETAQTVAKNADCTVIVTSDATNAEAKRRIEAAKLAVGQQAATTLYEKLFGFNECVEGLAKGSAFPGLSPIHGRGLFAQVDIPRGAVIVCHRGVSYLDGVGASSMIYCRKVPGLLRYVPYCGPALSVPVSPSAVHLMNHSCDPNVHCGLRYREGNEAWRSALYADLFPHQWELWYDSPEDGTADGRRQTADGSANGRVQPVWLLESLTTTVPSSAVVSLPPDSSSVQGKGGSVKVDPNCFVASRDIRHGEELTLDYSVLSAPLYADDFGTAPATRDGCSVAAYYRSGRCHCGSPSCKGYILPDASPCPTARRVVFPSPTDTRSGLPQPCGELVSDPLVLASQRHLRGALVAQLQDLPWRYCRIVDVACALIDATSYLDDIQPVVDFRRSETDDAHSPASKM